MVEQWMESFFYFFVVPMLLLSGGVYVLYLAGKDIIPNRGFWIHIAVCFLISNGLYTIPAIYHGALSCDIVPDRLIESTVAAAIMVSFNVGFYALASILVLVSIHGYGIRMFVFDTVFERILIYVPYLFVGYFCIGFRSLYMFTEKHFLIAIYKKLHVGSGVLFVVFYIVSLLLIINKLNDLHKGKSGR